MKYYNANLDSLLSIKIKNFLLSKIILFLLFVFLLVFSFLQIYDPYSIYVIPTIEDGKMYLNTNALYEKTDVLLDGNKIRYKDGNYTIYETKTTPAEISPQTNLAYNVVQFQIENTDVFHENTIVKVKLLKNKQRIITKLIQLMK